MPQDRYDAQQASAPADQAPPEDSSAQFREEGVSPEEAGPATDGPPADGGAALVEPADEAIRRLTAEVDEVQDRYLRLAAEFDNFRKRVTRERQEIRARAQAEVVANTLDALDDMGRVTEFDAAQASVQDVLEGVRLVERKLLRDLETAGLARIGQAGERFDPQWHEAVGTVPASSPDDDGTVAAVLQVGYRFGDVLLRPARVRVAMTPDEEESG